MEMVSRGKGGGGERLGLSVCVGMQADWIL